jgi:hypothetical protein
MPEITAQSTGIALMEIKEFCYANVVASRIFTPYFPAQQGDYQKFRDDVRAAMRLCRFDLMIWLKQNGVTIPDELISDTVHRPVGEQSSDAYAGKMYNGGQVPGDLTGQLPHVRPEGIA